MVELNRYVIFKNKNTGYINEGFVKSILQTKEKTLVSIGEHYVSWFDLDDLEIIEIKEKHWKKS